MITLEAVPLSFRPVAMAAEAIRGEDLEDFDAALTTLPSLQGPLADALSSAGPVDVRYYYSLDWKPRPGAESDPAFTP